jgi:hypothetical protein
MNSLRTLLAAAMLAGSLGAIQPVHADELVCRLAFEMSGWSAFYKTASGGGTVTCDNGQSMVVKLRAKGGGLTFGKTEIEDGHGRFSGIHRIEDVLGHYATAEAHAGSGASSSKAQVVTKGDVSLALTGTGHGFNLGVAAGAFIIER